MLWPYVRNAGDCLTDAEVKAGQSGVYSGPVNTNPDISGIRVEKPVQNTVTATTPSARPPAAPSAPARPLATAPARSVTSVSPNGARNENVACHKGLLWPFRREPGDCLTSGEREHGTTGVYGGGTGVTQVSAVTASTPAGANSALGAVPTPGAPPAAKGPATVSADTSPEPPVETCHKGLLWPFVKRSGDCPTAAEKSRGQ
jgi:hypothetical protein